jgi:hypothetical protein
MDKPKLSEKELKTLTKKGISVRKSFRWVS